MKRIAVGDVMTRNFISVTPETNLLQSAKIMVKKRVSGVPVVKDKRLLGMLTQGDILWAITKKHRLNLKEVKAIDIATRKIAVVKPSADLTQAFEKMRNLGLRRLPVMSKGDIVGMLTLKDILLIEPSLYGETNELGELREWEEKLKKAKRAWPLEGLCEECGAFSELLSVEGRLLCPDCCDELH